MKERPSGNRAKKGKFELYMKSFNSVSHHLIRPPSTDQAERKINPSPLLFFDKLIKYLVLMSHCSTDF